MKALAFLGSVRESTPPRPARLGHRVTRACANRLAHHDIDVDIIDPLDLEKPATFKPHFAYAHGRAPDSLETLVQKIEAADCYLMVSPEYNHAMSPALADTLNHFGSSGFSFKPSAIVTYSAGQWGGARAAVNMRTFLGELGCLPVSAMIHVPKAQEVFTEDGGYTKTADAAQWDSYIDRTLKQLVWWSAAARAQREVSIPTKAFVKDPSDRNAPDAGGFL